MIFTTPEPPQPPDFSGFTQKQLLKRLSYNQRRMEILARDEVWHGLVELLVDQKYIVVELVRRAQ